jgi:universal bacterial protein YeaZ
MSKLLALDASTEVCSVAVTDGSTVVQRYCDTPKSHSKVLLPLINEVLEEAKIALSDLDALAVTRGPGSFTGIRIGLGIIQGLSYGAKLPVIGLNTLDVMAEQYRATLSCMSGSIIVPALDARMGEVYWSAYRAENEHCEAVIPAAVCAPLCALEELKAQFSLEDVHG